MSLAERWLRCLCCWICLSLGGLAGLAQAHDVPPSTLMLDLGRSGIQLDMDVPLSELVAALGQPLPEAPEPWVLSQHERLQRYFEAHWGLRSSDGRPYEIELVEMHLKAHDNPRWRSQLGLQMRWMARPPEGASTTVFSLDFNAVIERVLNHEALVYVRRDVRNGLLGDKPLLVGELGFGSTQLRLDSGAGSWWQALWLLFRHGMGHIAEGTDHLLFLLALLLCAPLRASQGRWLPGKPLRATLGSVVAIISAFTAGHSVSLALASLGWVNLPAVWIESGVAASILVSCSQAWRPWLGSSQVVLAGFFGLVHGLAFAEALRGLDFDGVTLAVSLLAFNLGIETMQLGVMALTLPLMLFASERRHASAYRLSLAGVAAACALAWLLERSLGWTNPLQGGLALLAPPPTWLTCVLGLASLAWVGQRAWLHRRDGQCGGGLTAQSKPG
ncbi:MAG: HupE/UreJ family protein [Curvibacter sp.]|nr:MAG: HupE/UreJ family protein [Curvibacter sp.]